MANDTNNTTSNSWPYAVPRKALQKWASERVTLDERPDGSIAVRFSYSGSTCSNLGHPLRAVLAMNLSAEDGQGKRWITSTGCRPAENDLGVTKMCACLKSPDRFLDELDGYNPLEGMDLESAIRWQPSIEMAGCLCSKQSRNHKWRNAIQAVHFALNQDS